jgi:hypothetical protein
MVRLSALRLPSAYREDGENFWQGLAKLGRGCVARMIFFFLPRNARAIACGAQARGSVFYAYGTTWHL